MVILLFYNPEPSKKITPGQINWRFVYRNNDTCYCSCRNKLCLDVYDLNIEMFMEKYTGTRFPFWETGVRGFRST